MREQGLADPDDTATSRFVTMSLCTAGPACIESPQKVWATREANKVDDIQGTRPELKPYRFVKKPLIERPPTGAEPTHLPHNSTARKGALDQVREQPLEGNKPKPKIGWSQKRDVNPNDRNYKLPSYRLATPEPATVCKRPTNRIDDIEGTAPAPLYVPYVP